MIIVFYVSFNSDFWYWPNFGAIFSFFFGPKWIIFGLGIRLEKYLGVHSLIHTNNFCLPFSCSICNLNFSMDGQTDKITYRSCPQSLENHVITMLQESTRNRLSIRLNMYVWIRFICDAWFGSNIDVFHGGGGRPPPSILAGYLLGQKMEDFHGLKGFSWYLLGQTLKDKYRSLGQH